MSSRLGLALCGLLLCVTARADGALHPLWELHGKHNTVYLLGSIHVLRLGDYPLAPALLEAYGNVKSVLMEVNLEEISSAQVQAEMLTSAILPDGKTLPDVLGQPRYGRAAALAHEVGVELSMFDQFAPWFAAEAISQLQLTQLGFQPEAGVEMYFMERARNDGKSVAGLETVHDQISLFQNMPLDTQAEYLVSSLEQASDLPQGKWIPWCTPGSVETCSGSRISCSPSSAAIRASINPSSARATANGCPKSRPCSTTTRTTWSSSAPAIWPVRAV